MLVFYHSPSCNGNPTKVFKPRDYKSAKIAWELQNDQVVIISQDL